MSTEEVVPFKVGDVVVLNSDVKDQLTPMVVAQLDKEEGVDYASCTWHNNDSNLEQDTVPVACLTLYRN